MSRLRHRAWGLSGRLIASYIVVTLAVVLLVEAYVLCFQVAPLALASRLQGQLQAQVDAAARSYAQQLAQRFPGGVPTSAVIGDSGERAQPGQAPVHDGTLIVPAITSRIDSNRAVAAVVAIDRKSVV